MEGFIQHSEIMLELISQPVLDKLWQAHIYKALWEAK